MPGLYGFSIGLAIDLGEPSAKCHTMEIGILNIQTLSGLPPILPDFMDGGHLGGEIDIQENQVLSRSFSYNGDRCP